MCVYIYMCGIYIYSTLSVGVYVYIYKCVYIHVYTYVLVSLKYQKAHHVDYTLKDQMGLGFPLQG